MIMYLNGIQIGYDIDFNYFINERERLNIGKNILNVKYCIDDKIFNCEKNNYMDLCYGVLKHKMNNHLVYDVCLLKDFIIFERIIKTIQRCSYRYVKKYLCIEDIDTSYNEVFSDIIEKDFEIKINRNDILKFVSFINNKDLNIFLNEKIYMIDEICNHKEYKDEWRMTYYVDYVIGKEGSSSKSKHDEMIEDINKLMLEYKKEEERKQKELERELGRKHIYKYNYVYIITDLTNNMKYIGKHSTNNLDDGYMGSGILLKEAQRNKGIEYFTKDILHMCETEGEAFKMERKEINKVKAYENDMYYNLV